MQSAVNIIVNIKHKQSSLIIHDLTCNLFDKRCNVLREYVEIEISGSFEIGMPPDQTKVAQNLKGIGTNKIII